MAAHNLANRKSQLSISILIGLLDRTSGYAGVTHLHKEPHQNSWIYPRVKKVGIVTLLKMTTLVTYIFTKNKYATRFLDVMVVVVLQVF